MKQVEITDPATKVILLKLYPLHIGGGGCLHRADFVAHTEYCWRPKHKDNLHISMPDHVSNGGDDPSTFVVWEEVEEP